MLGGRLTTLAQGAATAAAALMMVMAGAGPAGAAAHWVSTGVRSVSAGGLHTCALKTNGTLWCWGFNTFGELGNGTTTDSSVPVRVKKPAGVRAWTAVSAGLDHTCALTSARALWCWGDNESGQLGNGTTTDSSVPVRVKKPRGTRPWVDVSAGDYHTCALTSGGAVWCWGRNTEGQLGNGTMTDSHTPVAVPRPHGVRFWAWVSAGGYHTCAVTTGRALWCWGWNHYGQLGNGTTTDSSVPVAVKKPNGVRGWTRPVSAGTNHTCALTVGHALWCWGWNAYGQLGNHTPIDSSVPVAVVKPAGVRSWALVSARDYHTCAASSGRTPSSGHSLWCWGWDRFGQLGDGKTTDSYIPVAVVTPAGVRSWARLISAGDDHTCALSQAGAVWCWGWNGHGQLGDGTTNDSSVPVPVVGMGAADHARSRHHRGTRH